MSEIILLLGINSTGIIHHKGSYPIITLLQKCVSIDQDIDLISQTWEIYPAIVVGSRIPTVEIKLTSEMFV